MKKLVVLAFALLLLLTACQGKEAGPTDQGTLTLVGLGSEIELTLAELRELDTYSGEANTINSANEETRRSFTGARVDSSGPLWRESGPVRHRRQGRRRLQRANLPILEAPVDSGLGPKASP